MGQIVFQKEWFAVLKARVTAKDHIIKIRLSNISSEPQILLQLGLMAHQHKLDCLVKRLDCSVLVKVKVIERFKIPVTVHLDDISSNAEPSVTKVAMVMHYHGPECHARRLVCCLRLQGHSEGSYNEI